MEVSTRSWRRERIPSAPAGGFTAGWGPTSRTYCTDCHTNDIPATGNTGYCPHWLPLLHILDGSTTTGAGTNYSTTGLTGAAEPLVSNTELCFKCHNYVDYVTSATATNTRFRDGNNNLHSEHMGGGFTNTTCYTCHDTHGSEQLHLINFDAAVAVPQGGRNSQSAWVSTGNANPTTTGTCSYDACHGQTHGAEIYIARNFLLIEWHTNIGWFWKLVDGISDQVLEKRHHQ